MTAPRPARPAIVLFAHGSRDPLWAAPIEAVAERIRTLAPDATVACAYLEYTAPTLDTVVAQLATSGTTAVSVWPMFLGAGRHAREDLPRLVEALRARYPGIAFSLQPAIAEHPQVLEAMATATLQPTHS